MATEVTSVIKTLTIEGRESGLSALASKIEGLQRTLSATSAAAQQTGDAAEKAGTSLSSTGAAFDRLRARVDPAFRATEDFNKAIRLVAQVVSSGKKPVEEIASVLLLLQERLEAVTKSSSSVAEANAAMAAGAASLREKLDPVAAAQGRFNVQVGEAASYLKEGLIAASEYGQAVAAAAAQIEKFAAAQGRAAISGQKKFGTPQEQQAYDEAFVQKNMDEILARKQQELALDKQLHDEAVRRIGDLQRQKALQEAQDFGRGVNERLVGGGVGSEEGRAIAAQFEARARQEDAAAKSLAALQAGSSSERQARDEAFVQASMDKRVADAQKLLEVEQKIAQEKRAQDGQNFRQDLDQRLMGGGISSSESKAIAEQFAEGARQAAIMAKAEADLVAEAKAFEEALNPALRAQNALNDALAKADALFLSGRISEATYSQGVDKAFADHKAATTGGPTAKDLASEERELLRVRNELIAEADPLTAAEERYQTRLAQTEKLVRAGMVTDEQAGLIRSKAIGQRNAAIHAYEREGRAQGFDHNQLTNLSYQLNDVVSGFAMGQSPGQILAQQGGQIFQIFQQGQNGIMGNVKALGTTIAGLMTPVVLVTGGLIALGAAGLFSFVKWQEQLDKLSVSISGIGRKTGLTRDNLVAISDKAAARNDFSTFASQDLAAGFASTGQIGSPMISALLDQTRKFSSVTGQDLQTAGGELAKAFSDPSKGADELNSKLGFLDDRTRQLIKTMSDSGDTIGAQGVLLKALSSDLGVAEDHTWTWTKAWRALGEAASDALAGTGRAVDRIINGPSIEEQIAKLKAGRKGMFNPRGGSFGGDVGVEDREGQIRDLSILNTENARRAFFKGNAIAQNEKSGKAGDFVRGLNPDIQAATDLKVRYDALKAAIDGGGDFGKLAVSADQAKDALDRAKQASDTYTDSTKKFAEVSANAIAGIMARTVAEKAAVAVKAELIAMEGQAIGTAERAARTAAAEAQVIAQANRTVADTLRSVQDSTATAGMLPYQKAIGDITVKYARLREEQGLSAQSLQDLTAARNLEIEAIYKEQVVKPITDANRAIDQQIAALKIQQDTFGKTTGAIAKATEAQRLMDNYKNNGITVSASMKAAIDAEAEAYGKVAQAQADVAYEQSQAIQTMDDIRGSSGNFLSSLVDGALSGKKGIDVLRDSLKGLLGDITKILERNLMEGLLGKAGTIGGDHPGVIGGWLQNLITGGKSKVDVSGLASSTLGVANIQAGIVNVNGALGAGGGAGGGIGSLLSDLIKNPKGFWANQASQGSGVGNITGIGPLGQVTSSALPNINPQYYNGGGPGTGFAGAAGSLLTRGIGGGGGALPTSSIADYIRLSATAHGIDPDVAVRVASYEGGLKSWNLQAYGTKTIDGIRYREPAFGPFQLLKGGGNTHYPTGLGNRAMAQGIDPAQASDGPAGIDVAMTEVAQKGWGQWFGAKAHGIGNMQGVGTVPVDQMKAAQAQLAQFGKATKDVGDAATSAAPAVTDLAKPVTELAKPVADATKGIGDLGKGAADTVTPLGDAAQGVSQLSNSLTGGSGGSTGLLSIFSKLFGGGGGGGGDWNFDIGSQGLASGFMHDGGFVGVHGTSRYIHPSYFDTAPRLHTGNIKADERPVVLQTGELVMSREHVAAARRGGQNIGQGNGNGDTAPRITVINQAVGDGYQSKQRSSSNGRDVVIEIMKSAIVRGEVDKPMQTRYSTDVGGLKR